MSFYFCHPVWNGLVWFSISGNCKWSMCISWYYSQSKILLRSCNKRNTGNRLLPLQWRHNECDGISNHQPNACLLNRLLRHRSKKTSKFYVTSLSEGNSAMTGEFPAYRASNAENVDFIMTNFGSSIRVYHVSDLIWYIWKFLTNIFI